MCGHPDASSPENSIEKAEAAGDGTEDFEESFDKLMNFEDLGGRFGWFASGDRLPSEYSVPFNRPSLRQIYDVWPFVIRYACHWLRHIRCPERLFINTFQPLRHRPFLGVPCGGIGGGAIGRDFRGGFCKYSLLPGVVEHDQGESVKANQFIVSLQRNGLAIRQVALSVIPAHSAGGQELSAWKFFGSASEMTYRGLYPRAWSRFEFPAEGAVVTCRQVSPILPNDYRDTSLPVAVFAFSVDNLWDEPLDASITFSFRDGTARQRRGAVDTPQSNAFHAQTCSGARLDHAIDQTPCTYAIGVACREKDQQNSIAVCTGFDPQGNGAALWAAIGGERPPDATYAVDRAAPKSRLGVAVTRWITVLPKSKSIDAIEFCLAWHMPIVQFGAKKRKVKRRYSRFFGVEPDAAADLCDYAFAHYRQWEAKIDDWQRPVLEHPDLPGWFKSALFNELYFLTDGGSIWLEYDDEWTADEPQLSDYTVALLREYGRFGYLESWEYRMINTYDVHFYASFALVELFPALEHVIHADMKDHVEHEDVTNTIYHMHGEAAPRKSFMRVPHDLGNPAVEPWLKTNAYIVHDTSKWKDLNLKFVLASYRNYYTMLNGDRNFLEFVWPTVKGLIEEALTHWDRDNDGMIENFGFADQTYDAWTMKGVSAYCGSLWLASLSAATEMARDIGDTAAAGRFADVLTGAKKVFEAKLWNGKYYNFDESERCGRAIMADQLCGYWYLNTANPTLAKDLIPDDHVRSALHTIFDYNVLKFGGGRMGAVNGMRPDGTVERSYIQADEMWTGISYALASFFIQRGDLQSGFKVAGGCYNTCFERLGLQFQTPEAVYEKRFYRAIGYMRPLAIWSIYGALRRQNFFPKHDDSAQ